MIDRDVALLLIGAAIALVSSIITLLGQHFLSLRADRVKRERDKREKKAEKLRERLLEGVEVVLLERRSVAPTASPTASPEREVMCEVRLREHFAQFVLDQHWGEDEQRELRQAIIQGLGQYLEVKIGAEGQEQDEAEDESTEWPVCP